MIRAHIVRFALVTFVAASTVMLAAPGQTRYTGTPSDIIRVTVINSGRTEAIPVNIQETASPLRVEVANKPTVVLDPATVVTARIAPRTWEYKLVPVHPGQAADDARALSADGAQGWEATGVVLTSPAGPTILLKRQK
jgi:hypothetical protein